MQAIATSLPGLLILESTALHTDPRGFFYEGYNQQEFTAATGAATAFVQDNHSRSTRNVVRGLHFQVGRVQGKLVRVIEGEVFDVAVDLRRSSATFGRWHGVRLSSDNRRLCWIPPGFAHGFVVLSDYAHVLYKVTDYFAPHCARAILWNDPELAIDWPLQAAPILSAKDAGAGSFREADYFA